MQAPTRTIIAALAASLLLAALMLFFIFRFLLPGHAAENAAVPAYTIGIWEGKVAVYEGADSHPMQIFDTPVTALPAEVREALEKGVRVDRAEELYQILEDYTS